MRYLLIILSLVLFSCGTSIVNEYDEYTSTQKVYQEGNKMEDYRNAAGTIWLNLSKHSDDKGTSVFFNFLYSSHRWLFVEQSNAIQILLDNGEIIKLSFLYKLDRTAYGDGIHERGKILLNKNILNKLLDNSIKSMRVYGDDFYVVFDTKWRIDKMQNEWKKFSNLHLEDFLK